VHQRQLLVVGHGRIVAPEHEVFVAPEAVIAAADIASLHAAISAKGASTVAPLIAAGREAAALLADLPRFLPVSA
jgi:hypothetical protein